MCTCVVSLCACACMHACGACMSNLSVKARILRIFHYQLSIQSSTVPKPKPKPNLFSFFPFLRMCHSFINIITESCQIRINDNNNLNQPWHEALPSKNPTSVTSGAKRHYCGPASWVAVNLAWVFFKTDSDYELGLGCITYGMDGRTKRQKNQWTNQPSYQREYPLVVDDCG